MTQSATTSRLFGTSAETGKKTFYRQTFLGIWLIYLMSACLLAVVVRFGVMDEDFHLDACFPFAKGGINVTTIYNHVPPTGVASHIWFAVWLRLIPGINYVGLRLTTCIAILLIGCFTYYHLNTLSSTDQKKVLAASWFTLVSPYFFLSSSTAMTEGPALMFLFAGLLLLLISRLQHSIPLFLASLFLGLATIARFYFIPLLPTLGAVFLLSDWQQYRQTGFQRFTVRNALPYLFIVVALLPLLGLILIWGGLTPPLFDQWSQLRSGVSLNPTRPISTLLITGVYVAPFVFANMSWKLKQIGQSLRIALPVALLLAVLRLNFFRTSDSFDVVFSGPIEHSLGWLQAKGDWALILGLFSVYSLSLFSLVVVVRQILHFIQLDDFTDKGLIYSFLFVVFFIVSQAFVGGNHPFYERYLIHAWPFIGYVLVGLFPSFLNVRTYAVLAGYTLASVIILTKWGFVTP